MSNIISSLGAGSGIDTRSLVDQLVDSERVPVESRLDNRQDKLDATISGYGALRSAMTGIQDKLALLSDPDTFNARNVNFPETNLLTPNAVDPDAQTGDYSIKVLNLATAHSVSSSSASLYADANAVVGNGTLTFNFGDWDAGSFTLDDSKGTQAITIDDSNNTLTGIRDAINDADFGVRASVVNTGNGYQLQFTGPSGASNEMSIEVTEDTPAGLSALSYAEGALSMDQNQVGADSQMEVNGLTITRSSNTVDDVIDGLEFTLNNISTTESVSINITADKSFAEQGIRDLVTGYNEFLDSVSALTGSGSDEEDASIGSLSRDGSAKTMINQIRSSMSQTIEGITGNYNALSTIGVETDFRTGKLSINEELLTAALNGNYKALTEVFTSSTSSSDTHFDVVRTRSTTAAGSFAVDVTTDPSKGGWSATNAIDTAALPAYQPATDDFSSPLVTDDTYTFQLSVDGTTSETLTLSGEFNSAEEIRAQMQSLINGDSKLSAVNAKVDVYFDSATDTFSIESRAWGSDSKVDILASGAGMDALGFDAANGTSTAGTDVVGTIDGVEAFGSGNILLPDLKSELSGMSIRIAPGAAAADPATITHSRGFANELNNILDSFLDNRGLIATRESNINDRLDDIDEDRDQLDTRMEMRRAQLESQYLAMERIIRSLNSTSSSLDGLVERLPFTASNN